jgi:CubicO group peptidase (beta-lactamase class C family)
MTPIALTSSRDSPGLLTATVVAGALTDHNPLSAPVPWWSLTKTALAAAALALVGDGRLSLDAPLSGRSFTLRQLLQHTAGLPDYGGLAAYHDAVARGDLPWSDGLLWRRVGADRLLFDPGQGWAYSNVGYLLVRRLIEETAGEEIGAALHRMVCGPLGVPGVRLAREPRDLSTTAWGNAAGYHPAWVYHGLLVGTPGEAALFLDGLLRRRLLRPALLRAMLESRPIGGPVEGRPWRAPAYGLGLMTDMVPPAGRCIGHSGAGPGSVAAAYHFPDLDPPRTIAAFALGGHVGIVERAALELP